MMISLVLLCSFTSGFIFGYTAYLKVLSEVRGLLTETRGRLIHSNNILETSQKILYAVPKEALDAALEKVRQDDAKYKQMLEQFENQQKVH
jgi:hypothetical protein